MPTGTPMAGKNSRVTVDSTNLRMADWSITPTVQKISTNNFESGGYDENIAGFKSCEVRVSGYWDAAQNPHDDPPNINIGEVITGVKLYLSVDSDLYWSFPEMLVLSTPTKSAAEGRVDFEFTAASHGTFTAP